MSRRAQVMAMIPSFLPKPRKGKRMDLGAVLARVSNALDWDAVDDAGNNPERLAAMVSAAVRKALN